MASTYADIDRLVSSISRVEHRFCIPDKLLCRIESLHQRSCIGKAKLRAYIFSISFNRIQNRPNVLVFVSSSNYLGSTHNPLTIGKALSLSLLRCHNRI